MFERGFIQYRVPKNESLDVDFYINQLKSITKEYPRDHARGKEYGGYHFVDGDTIAIESEFGEKLMNEIAEFKPDNIVEIGTAHGYSTCWILIGMLKARTGSLITFDEVVRKWHFENIPGEFKFYPLDFKKAKDHLPNVIDFVFHDADHTPEGIMKDMDLILPNMSKRGQIWIHDAYDHISEPLRDYYTAKGWDYVWIKESSHLGFAKRKL